MTLSPRMELTGPHFCATMYTAYRVDLNTLEKEGKFLAIFQDFGIAIGFAIRINFRTVKSWTEKFILPLDCRVWD